MNTKSFRDLLKAWRIHMGRKQSVALAAAGRSGFSQRDAAEYLRVPVRTYQGWERERDPKEPGGLARTVVVENIAKTYKVHRRRVWR